jgi:hypothetical protein
MTCRFCGRPTRGPWKYCDADCEADHEAELASADAPDDAQEPPTATESDFIDYDALIDADAPY